jgi:hypothetical protein
MAAKDRHHRHDRHVDKESAYLRPFLGDDNHDDGMTVTKVLSVTVTQKPHRYGKRDDGDAHDDEIQPLSKGGATVRAC